ncbi:hypothetical protein ACFL3Z_01325 [Gemmatimonadota bacterium]
MKTLFGIGLGVLAIVSVASLTRKPGPQNLQSDEWRRRHAWPDAPTPLNDEVTESEWYKWAA